MGWVDVAALRLNLITKAHLTGRAAVIRLQEREKERFTLSFSVYGNTSWKMKGQGCRFPFLDSNLTCVRKKTKTFVLNITL